MLHCIEVLISKASAVEKWCFSGTRRTRFGPLVNAKSKMSILLGLCRGSMQPSPLIWQVSGEVRSAMDATFGGLRSSEVVLGRLERF